MPPLPTISQVYRLTLPFVGITSGINPALVFHFKTTLTDLDDIGTDFDNTWQTVRGTAEPIFAVCADFIATTLDILPLDGTSATHTYTLGTLIQGNTTGECSPASAAVVSFKSAQRGPQGRGRKYLGPIAEAKMVDGRLETAARTQMQTAWNALLAAWDNPTGSLQLVVASYVHAAAYPVTSAVVQQLLGTQRRLQDQLR